MTTTTAENEIVELKSGIRQPWPFDYVRIDRRTGGGSIIYWELLNNAKLSVNYFDVYFVERGTGELDYIGPTADFLLIDNQQRSFSLLKEGGYVVKLMTSDGKEYWSNISSTPVTWNERDYIYAGEIIRRERQLYEYSGRGTTIYLLHRKWGGAVCENCVDLSSGESTNPLCKNCYGTKYDGGYYRPVEVKGGLLGFEKKLGGDADQELETFSIRTVDAPFVSHYDIIVLPETDKRFEVVGINPLVSIKGHPIVYGLQGQILKESHVIYTQDILEEIELEEYIVIYDGNV